MFFSTAVHAQLNPVLVADRDRLAHMAYALAVMATKADNFGSPAFADNLRSRAYYLRSLAR